ncbi:MAG: hypothetical protein QNJ31_06445 [Candidatus Caenarcaniphilales bacterium]|nr:hypothetical protein [Candidatus Caenarcaniphilales bacterium]
MKIKVKIAAQIQKLSNNKCLINTELAAIRKTREQFNVFNKCRIVYKDVEHEIPIEIFNDSEKFFRSLTKKSETFIKELNTNNQNFIYKFLDPNRYELFKTHYSRERILKGYTVISPSYPPRVEKVNLTFLLPVLEFNRSDSFFQKSLNYIYTLLFNREHNLVLKKLNE